MATQRKKKGRTKNSRYTLPLLIGTIAVVVIAIVTAVFALHGYRGDSRWIYVTDQMTQEALRDTLKSRLGSPMGTRVYMLYKLQGGNVNDSRGAYKVEHGQNALGISHRIAGGHQTPVKVTFNNVRTMEEFAEKVTQNLACSPKEFLAACDETLPAQGFAKAEFPAAFLPDSYEFYWSATPSRIVKRLVDYRNEFWTPERRQKAKKLGLSPSEVATIASIAEEESTKREERPVIARVYLNRLKKGMKLQACPTVKFAVGNPGLKRVTGTHLRINSPYNTYRNPGLPPGPIRIPDQKTIDQVLDAPMNDYLYFCARPDFSGYNDFASDYATHAANAKRYQAALDRLGIK